MSRNGRSNGHHEPTKNRLPRLQIPATDRQRLILRDAAERAGTDLSTWCLAHCLKAANSTGIGDPIVISGAVADRARTIAADQGTTPERIVEMALMTSEDSR